jgi:hypothetical protein
MAGKLQVSLAPTDRKSRTPASCTRGVLGQLGHQREDVESPNSENDGLLQVVNAPPTHPSPPPPPPPSSLRVVMQCLKAVTSNN